MPVIARNGVTTQSQPEASDATVFYTDGFGVKITSINVISGKKIYELGEIKSFRVDKYPKSKRIPTIMTVCGALLLAMNIINMNTIRLVFGAIMFIIGVSELVLKPVYMIRILTLKGEYPILKSRDNARVDKMNDALKVALVMRKGSEADPD